ncbi:hypothetical protein Patl1_07756 [Pistacia atlantica]|uniref:Uncharacterized protein n=1 Tax=Pistacia atlantica TaxID=434234 RepID=A0ACC1AKV0_9ROSI|nr:hypothetical protein Patl1_07756 [Pistacia atlantica]
MQTLSFINCFNMDLNAIGSILKDALFKLYSDTHLLLELSELGIGSPQVVMCLLELKFLSGLTVKVLDFGCSIHLPQGSFNHKFLGFVFCAIIGANTMELEYELSLKCKDGYRKVTGNQFWVDVYKYSIESDHAYLGYNFLNPYFEEFSSNTEAIIDVNAWGPKFSTTGINFSTTSHLKKCGIRLLFAQDFEEPIKRSRCTLSDEEEAESKSLKSSNFCKGNAAQGN